MLGTKGKNNLCSLSLNNCASGLACVDDDDGCDNDVGKCRGIIILVYCKVFSEKFGNCLIQLSLI